jgi:hypothetical protein
VTPHARLHRMCRAPNCLNQAAGKRDAFCREHVGQGRTCSVEGCNLALFRLGMCMAHAQQKYRGQPIKVEIRVDPVEEAILAVFELADCPAEDQNAYQQRRRRMMRAIDAIAKSRGWKRVG